MKKRHTDTEPMSTNASGEAAEKTVPAFPGALLVPPPSNSRPFDQLTDEEVVARIGRLLFEGYLLAQAAASAPVSSTALKVVPIRVERRDKHDVAVLAILRGGETATPMTLRTRVGCSRATISRVLARLLRNGEIVSTGKTKGICYGIARKEVRAA